MNNNKSLTDLNELEMKQINGGAIPVLVVAFAKGFGGGVAGAAAVDVAYKAVKKMID